MARFWAGPIVLGALGLAQAAAIFLAVSLCWSGPRKGTAHYVPPSLDSVVDVPDGQVLYIRSAGSELELLDVTAFEASNGEDPWFNFLNRAEGESGSAMVAMSE
jgi:hypothetical protein